MRKLVLICCVAIELCTGSFALAGQIKKRERHEQQRIDAGVRRGQLTHREANRLENQQSVIELERRQALADGKMGRRERRDIRHDQNRLSHDIYNKRHNAKRVHTSSAHHHHRRHHPHHPHHPHRPHHPHHPHS